MSIRTAEQLSDILATDLAWRKKELSEIKSLIELKNVSPQRHNVCIRSGICILYAHWESFVKLAANSYLEYVDMQRLRYDQLASNFLALAMKEKLKDAKDTNKPSLYIPVCDFFLSQLNTRCSLPKKAISTASNLSSQVLKDITDILGLDFSLYFTKSKLIDESLLKSRNEIAHGNDLLVSREKYIELHTEIIAMLDMFSNQIQNAAVNKDFMLNK